MFLGDLNRKAGIGGGGGCNGNHQWGAWSTESRFLGGVYLKRKCRKCGEKQEKDPSD